MSVLVGALTLPFFPVRGVLRLAERMLDPTGPVMPDPDAVRRHLAEIEELCTLGHISESDATEARAELLKPFLRK